MKIRDSKRVLLKRLQSSGVALSEMTVPMGVDAMIEFYMAERATDCDVNAEGDMLLWQWGPSFDKTYFEVDLTRQFIASGDDEPHQLSLNFRFSPSPELAEMEITCEWCHGPSETESFRKHILESTGFRTVERRAPKTVALTLAQC
jgi:hypothetical protein